MEIDIQSKTDNPLLKRTEVHFTIHHEGEKTPKRELVRSELADKLNVKKENILVNYMKSSFGSTDTVGFAKVYKSVKDAKSGEKNHLLKRNNIAGTEKKPSEKKEEKPKAEQPDIKPKETQEVEAEKPVEEKTDKPDETPAQEPKDDESVETKEEPNVESTPPDGKPKEEEKPKVDEKPAE